MGGIRRYNGRGALAAGLLMFAAFAPVSRVAAQDDVTPPEVFEKLKAATVYIETSVSVSSRDWSRLPGAWRAGRRPGGDSSGSGFLISSDGYVITNAHVLSAPTILFQFDGEKWDATEVDSSAVRRMPYNPERPLDPFTLAMNSSGYKVVVRSGEDDEKKYSPRVVKVDKRLDLAVLKIIDPEPFEYLDLNPDLDITSGVKVYMSGFPGGKISDIAPFLSAANAETISRRNPRVSINSGMISAVREYKGNMRYQLDARANHGNSGGPITDIDGNVVAVLYAGIDELQSVNYAIPAKYIDLVVPTSMRLGTDGGGGLFDDAATTATEEKSEGGYDDFLKSADFSFGD